MANNQVNVVAYGRTFGIPERYEVYRYGTTSQVTVLLTLANFSDFSMPHIKRQKEFFPLSVVPSIPEYLRAKKPIYSLLSPSNPLVELRAKHKDGQNQFSVKLLRVRASGDLYFLEPILAPVPEELLMNLPRLGTPLLQDPGNRALFLEQRLRGNY